jgi:hypothetical protein
MGGKFRCELMEDNIKNQGGEHGAEGATLGKTFKLTETVPVRCMSETPGGVGNGIK